MRNRQRAQPDDIDEMKDGGVGADAECEGEDGDRREDRAFPQRSHRVSQIDSHRVDPPEAAGLTYPFLPSLRSAEFESRPTRGFMRSHARPDQIGRARVDMELDLLGHLIFERTAPEEVFQ